jgi:hypothetical protein
VPERNDHPSAVIIGCSIDVADDTSVVIVLFIACAVDAFVAVERNPTDAAIVELSDAFSADAASVGDSGNRGKEG